MYTPSAIFSNYSGVSLSRVLLPQWAPECDEIYDRSNQTLYPCDYAPGFVKKFVTNKLQAQAPHAYQLITQLTFDDADMSDMLGRRYFSNLSIHDAACNWIKSNPVKVASISSRRDRRSRSPRDRSRDRSSRKKRRKSRSRSPPPRNAPPPVDVTAMYLDDPETAAAAPFEWHKKKKRDKKLGIVEPEGANDPAQFREELDLLQRRRQEREEERRLREEERIQAQRDADRAQFGDWEAREDEFQLRQARTRAEIRVKEGRAMPIDILAMALQLATSPELFERGFDVDPRPPYRLVEHLTNHPTELKMLARDIEMYMWLEQEPQNQRFWQCLLTVAQDTLRRIEHPDRRVTPACATKSRPDLRKQRRASAAATRTDEQYDDHHDVMVVDNSMGDAGGDAGRSNEPAAATTDADINAKANLTPEQLAKDEPQVAGDDAYLAKEIDLANKAYNWAYKYRPRKPKYVNRVNTGYEWNKYNQTHYDSDNPPPKVVQGYKFNIFYPDLLDKSRAPTYRIEPKADGTKDTVILRFIAGPPYEDIAFEIVNKEWEMSHRRGFRCVYDRGVLQLHFQFRRYFYRK
ncbi:hypothetical protein AMAG_18210 [Allomyces macrogynus ATCC 38327]|uniref:Splicing factor Cactin n=1 Tax=Allomyces macrogynus (strain ATCC 38327) TaxID=578462 RepID=A0A0L0SB11_ALLM3|nr:hypothetical protein AMAG_18210 [Allomyces macrogynus ATCC 38327]|eukprot:KNE59589.1 hypothetical protein AMAG_18210 [Allomyces macrogynus ATCC 38327]